MKNFTAKPFKFHNLLAAFSSVLVVGLLALPARVQADEFPAGCSLANGGLGNTSQGGINFPFTQAHVGDSVPVNASLGMVLNACQAVNAIGSVWLASGRLTNFLVNVTLDPGPLISCPPDGLCRPGPYNVLITPALVGAGVNSPNGSIPGSPKTVRAVQNGEGTVRTGAVPEQLADFHTATIGIVQPCIAVVKQCAYPANSPTCFPAGSPIDFTGYVTNCGDIRLTNVTVVDNRTPNLFTPAGLPLFQPLILDPGQAVPFKGSFQPTVEETCAGSAANTITVRGTDITIIQGPNASVTNQTIVSCAICVNPCLAVTKSCDTVTVGSANTVSGAVTNCGNITITNIVISDNLYGTLLTIPTLASGASQSYSRLVTNATCGSFPNTVTANGTTVCGQPITAQAISVCVVTENPCIRVTATCSTVLNSNVLTIVVTNCGNVTITGIEVVNNPDDDDDLLGLIPSLSPGQTATITNSFPSCFPVFGEVGAFGLSLCGRFVASALEEYSCGATAIPCLTVSKNCDTVNAGSANTVSGWVTNCGNITIANIVISDNLYGTLATIPSLAPGAGQTYSRPVTNSTCGSFPNTVTANGTTVCGAPLTAQATATCVVRCAPKICVTKEVACELPTGCGSYSDLATGAKSADNSECPSFCYRVRVTNCGQEPLQNVTVIDNVLALAACNFPTSLAVGQTVECIVAGVEHCDSVTNTVTASGVGASSGIGVSTNDSAAVVVAPIGITANVTANGQSSLEIPCDGQSHPVTNAVEICNTGALPLENITISAPNLVALGGDCTNVASLNLALLPGECTNLTLCVNTVTCPPDCPITLSNHVQITATPNVCSWTRNASNQVVAITASATGDAFVSVKDTIPPTVTCSTNRVVEAASCDGAVVTYITVASDNCSITNLNCSPAGSLFPLGVTTVTCTASDRSGNTNSCSFTVTVCPPAPPIIVNPSVDKASLWPPNHKMQLVTVNYTITGDCTNAPSICTLTVTSNEPINGTGDGDTAPDWEIVDEHHVRLRAERAGTGTGRIYTIAITCGDICENRTTNFVRVVVAHDIKSPVSGASFRINTSVSFAGTFWDRPGNRHTALWQFDNLSTAGLVTEPGGLNNGQVKGSYKFSAPGVYKVTLNIKDQNGLTSWVNTAGDVESIVVIYDPNGGYTIGGGYINSPAGAYTLDPNAAGKLTYGFNSQYFKGAANPKGEALVKLLAGNLEFNALNYEYLSISGAKAQFRGFGKVNGASGYNFIMTVVDGALAGDGVGKFRMKIWEKNSGTVIYDNEPGRSDADTPITPVGKASSVIIKK